MATLQSFIDLYSDGIVDVLGGVVIIAVIVAAVEIIKALMAVGRKKIF